MHTLSLQLVPSESVSGSHNVSIHLHLNTHTHLLSDMTVVCWRLTFNVWSLRTELSIGRCCIWTRDPLTVSTLWHLSVATSTLLSPGTSEAPLFFPPHHTLHCTGPLFVPPVWSRFLHKSRCLISRGLTNWHPGGGTGMIYWPLEAKLGE